MAIPRGHLNDELLFSHLGVELAEPFEWGDEPQMTIVGVDKPKPLDPSAQLSGLDSLKIKIVQDTDDDEKRILRFLFLEAGVDLSVPVPKLVDDPNGRSSKERQCTEQALIEDVARDVSIKGLSDRAVAELTVESRTSLFGSVLRLFELPRDGKNPDGSNSKKSADVVTKDACDGKENITMVAIDPMIAKEPILSTAEIVRSVHLTARPGDVPAGMDSKEYTMAVLHFLASYVPHLHEDESEYRTGFDGTSQEGWDQLRETFPVLPLIRATNPGERLELRRYGRVKPRIKLGQKERREHPDSMDWDQAFRRKVLNLERAYSSSLPFSSPFTAAQASSKSSLASTPLSSSKGSLTPSLSKAAETAQRSGNDLPFAFQRYVPRRKLLPHIEGGAKEELTLMISGHMQQPQHTPGPKPKVAKSKTAAPGPKGKAIPTAKSASAAGAAVRTNPSTEKEEEEFFSYLTPSKRKGDKTADGLLHLSNKAKEFTL